MMSFLSEVGLGAEVAAGVGAIELLAFRLFAEETTGGDVESPWMESLGGRERAQERELAQAAAVAAAREDGFAAGEREGRVRARAEMEVEMAAAAARQREQLGAVVRAFAEERGRYFAGVEAEVVKLALGIAARVLHREAQVDGLLLRSAVRVALETIADRSTVVLRTAAGDVAAWEGSFAGLRAEERPRVIGDAGLERGACVLETKMGTVELGVTTQLEEIEKGFFDLLHHRPR